MLNNISTLVDFINDEYAVLTIYTDYTAVTHIACTLRIPVSDGIIVYLEDSEVSVILAKIMCERLNGDLELNKSFMS